MMPVLQRLRQFCNVASMGQALYWSWQVSRTSHQNTRIRWLWSVFKEFLLPTQSQGVMLKQRSWPLRYISYFRRLFNIHFLLKNINQKFALISESQLKERLINRIDPKSLTSEINQLKDRALEVKRSQIDDSLVAQSNPYALAKLIDRLLTLLIFSSEIESDCVSLLKSRLATQIIIHSERPDQLELLSQTENKLDPEKFVQLLVRSAEILIINLELNLLPGLASKLIAELISRSTHASIEQSLNQLKNTSLKNSKNELLDQTKNILCDQQKSTKLKIQLLKFLPNKLIIKLAKLLTEKLSSQEQTDLLEKLLRKLLIQLECAPDSQLLVQLAAQLISHDDIIFKVKFKQVHAKKIASILELAKNLLDHPEFKSQEILQQTITFDSLKKAAIQLDDRLANELKSNVENLLKKYDNLKKERELKYPKFAELANFLLQNWLCKPFPQLKPQLEKQLLPLLTNQLMKCLNSQIDQINTQLTDSSFELKYNKIQSFILNFETEVFLTPTHLMKNRPMFREIIIFLNKNILNQRLFLFVRLFFNIAYIIKIDKNILFLKKAHHFLDFIFFIDAIINVFCDFKLILHFSPLLFLTWRLKILLY